ncbi:DUF748 domain-containing protein [Rhodoferax sp.]|uniref:DUF748 domain-containing protein n=1 Tax=Rhodoferax sp. TaxID=50421 RepID=UPI00261458B8|nr:DUF748 domain-containing protein [Rhodoferax sp.]MDD2809950.1 DUF748 domain-containing protein [Rhodoferax sp.]
MKTMVLKHAWARRLLWVVGGVAVLWLLIWLVVPPLLKSQLQSRLGEQLGRTVTVGQVDFKPWTLELTLQDVAVAHASDASPQALFQRLHINMELQSLLRLAPVVDALELNGLQLNLTHTGGGHYDVDDVLARLAAQPSEPAASPLHFALYNLVLSDAAVLFTDTPHHSVHRLSQLNLSVPFVSNLDSKRDVLVQPRLAFDLNGSQFDSSANATPFAPTRQADAQLVVKALDLAPYLPYWPASLPVRLQSAVLDANLKLSFKQQERPQVLLSGQVGASGVRLAQVVQDAGYASGTVHELLAFDRLNVVLADVQPLAQKIALQKVELLQPHLLLHRNPSGVLNLQALTGVGSESKNTLKKEAVSADTTEATAQKDVKNSDVTPSVAGWQVQVDELSVAGAEVVWVDDSAAQPVRLRVTPLALNAHALSWPLTQPMPFDGTAVLAGASLRFKGEATDTLADASVQVNGLPLSMAAPYLASVLKPRLDGVLTTDLALHWAAATAKQSAQTRVQVASLALDKLALRGAGKTPLASVERLAVTDAMVDVLQQSVQLGRVQLSQPRTTLSRSSDGRWMVDEWLSSAQTNAPHPASAAATPTQRPWSVALKEVGVIGGALAFRDASISPAVALDVSGLALQVRNFSSTSAKPFATELSARVSSAATEPGTLSWRGSVGLSPLATRGDLKAVRLPLHALSPYLNDKLNVAVLRADTSFDGKLQLAQSADALAMEVLGNARLDELQVQTLAQTEPFKPAEDLLNWKSLSLTGLRVALAPGAAPQVDVAGTALSDFYAKVVIDPTGRLNLQDMVKPTASTAPKDGATATAAIAAIAASAAAPVPASAPVQTQATPSTPTATATATATVDLVSASSKPLIHFGPVSLVGGNVNFTDRFIQPNYSADLTELVGKLSAFSSQPVNGAPELADLELRGRAQGTASLEVLGKINPLVQPVALDISGKVRDLELAPLSTYSARYAGYGIERGKLSVDVSYLVKPDGQLSANNKVVLNQLKFGEAIPNAVNTLPVKLAVALLADRNGVIDIDLPISGSLNDPQFRLMPLVFKVIGNLIVKAITAPFSLLANAFGGGGDDLSSVAFDAGSARLTDAAKASLAKVVKALQDRPALKMTVTGTASLQAERDGYKRAQLQTLVLNEKRRSLGAAAAQGAPGQPVAPQVTPQEYPALLKAVYKRADFPKPRNLIGMAKDLPVPEMEALLQSHLDATEAAMQALALQRGVVVRDYLASQQLPMERLFLGAAKAVAPDAKWQPHAELNLAAQ